MKGSTVPARATLSRRASRWSLVAAALSGLLASTCGGAPEPASGARPTTWQRIEDGWARAVALDEPFVLEGARGGDALEAVVLPSGPGELVVESRGGIERVAVAGVSRVLVPLGKGGPATVSFDGPAATLHAPRIVRDASSTRRRILLVVIDTLRADAATPDGMPELLDYFAKGARFTHAYSPATWTLPSMASLFTGKHPTELALPDGTLIALAAGEPTIAGDLAERGFHTAGISANYTVNHENGFSSGFDLFMAPAVLGHGDWPGARWVFDRARRVLDWFPDRDLFLYLHLMEPHDPYLDEETGEALAAPSTGSPADAAAVGRMRVAYASEARRVSALLAEFLEEAGPFERVVVTADHGEEFLEHGGFKHGPTVYPEVSRVPLLIRGAGVEAGTFDAPISLLGLRRFLAAEGGAFPAGEDVEVVSFVHAAPRFSWAREAGQAVLFGRDLEQPETPPNDPIGDWLRLHHPALDFVDPDGAPRAPGDGEAWDTALRLAKRFRGLHPGRWVLVPGGVERLRVELDGSERGGWWWGGAERVGLERPAAAEGEAAGRAHAVLDIEAPDPFVLLFIPGSASGVGVSRAEQGSLDEIDGPPPTPPSGGAVTWRDPGRPAAALEGVEETMRRLRTQGYI